MKLLKIFLLSISFIVASFSQEEGRTSTGVELPDFVITGKDVVKIKKSEKLNPFLISTFSEKFVMPVYSPEEIPVKKISLPVRDDLNLLGSNNFYKGYIAGAIGFYSLPDLDILYATPIENGIFRTKLNGFYNRQFVDNSDNYKLAGGADLIYWTDINSSFLPGTQFRINTDLSTRGYKFYGSSNPTEKRNLTNLLGNINIKNEYNSSFLFKINAIDNFTSLGGENFKENLIDLNLNTLLRLAFINIGFSGNIKSVSLSNDTSDHKELNYLLIRPTAGFQFTSLAKGSFGFTISRSSQDRFIMPYAELAVKLAPNFTFLGEFNPTSEFLTPANFLSSNPFFDVVKSTNLFIKKSMQYQMTVKYEYQRFFEINGGFKYFSSDSLPYFYEKEKGKYSLRFSDIKSMTPYVNFNFFPGPYGFFFGSLEINAAQNDTGQTFPYIPTFKLTANYGYTFNEVLTSSLNLVYAGKTFTDINNLNKIDNYINLGLSLAYNFDQRFDFFVRFENLINNSNYIWNNYKEKPFDIILGVKYKL
jgi:hypothetical protein